MNVNEIVKSLNLEVIVGENLESKSVKGVYICDLLSNVMAHGQQDDLWITIQTHQNILAVASLLNFSAILLPENLLPDATTIEKAKAQGIIILKSPEGAFNLAGKLYEMGLRGL
jgi:serine kinase of HPr protein (carbohydrate metabolism regulator)